MSKHIRIFRFRHADPLVASKARSSMKVCARRRR